MDQKLDSKKMDAALDRAAHKALHGTREERAGRFITPRAFLSYSHDGSEHHAWVRKLASDLRAVGVDVVLDQWDLVPGQDISLFMQKGISDADRVIMVCSPSYVPKAEKGVGGVGFERLIVTAEVLKSIDTTKFIPILRGSNPAKKLPSFLGPRFYIDFSNDADYEAKVVELAREIHGAPAISKPSLGSNPFSAVSANHAASNSALSVGKASSEEKSISNEWFRQEASRAQNGLAKVNLSGFDLPLNFHPAAIRASAVDTPFGAV